MLNPFGFMKHWSEKRRYYTSLVISIALSVIAVIAIWTTYSWGSATVVGVAAFFGYLGETAEDQWYSTLSIWCLSVAAILLMIGCYASGLVAFLFNFIAFILMVITALIAIENLFQEAEEEGCGT